MYAGKINDKYPMQFGLQNRTAAQYLQPEDLFRIHVITEAQISPDGTRICFVQKDLVPEKNKYRSHLFMVPASGGNIEPFTGGDHQDFSPAWSPDGKWIAFLSTRSGSPQVWVISAYGGEARKVTSCKDIIGRPVWAPDGQRIAFTVLQCENDTELEGEEAKTLPPKKRFTSDVQRIDTLPYKENGVGLIGEKFEQVAVVHLKKDEMRILTKGRIDHKYPIWSQDGRSLAFSLNGWNAVGTSDPNCMFIGGIGLIPSEGGRVSVLVKSPGPCFSPSFSPDGRTIAYIGHNGQYGNYTQPSVWTVNTAGGEPRNLTAGFDRPFWDHCITDLTGIAKPSPPAWSPDGRSIYTLASLNGMTHLVRVELKTGYVQPAASGQRAIYNFSMARDSGTAALCSSDPLIPNDIFLLNLRDAAHEKRLTDVNGSFLKTVKLSMPEQFTVQSEDVAVEGWILRPSGKNLKANTPAVLQVHGGPFAMYGYRFLFGFQLLASNGITVIYSNPRGSMGYGQAFTAAIRGDWGNKDFKDINNIIEAAAAQGGIDLERLGILGGSYGGFMVNWAVGHTGRFRAAAAISSISNQYSLFGTSDFGFTKYSDMGELPWNIPDNYLAHSPISFVGHVKTPLLMIHTNNDMRTPLSEAEQFYTALKLLGREVILLLYPGENHKIISSGKPWHRVHLMESIVRWFVKKLKL